MSDLINRQDAIDASRNKTVSTNPEDFYAHNKFIKFMDNPETTSYGRWEWANGYNTALVSMRIELDKMPSAEPERKTGRWIHKSKKLAPLNTIWWHECSACGHHAFNGMITDYCPNCGARMVNEE